MNVQKLKVALILGFLFGFARSHPQQHVQLDNGHLKIRWHKTQEGWAIQQLAIRMGNDWQPIDSPSGEYTLIRAAAPPEEKSEVKYLTTFGQKFPGERWFFPEDLLLPRWALIKVMALRPERSSGKRQN